MGSFRHGRLIQEQIRENRMGGLERTYAEMQWRGFFPCHGEGVARKESGNLEQKVFFFLFSLFKEEK